MRFLSRTYDLFVLAMEALGVRCHRRQPLSRAVGGVLEGAWGPAGQVTEVVAFDPNP